MIRIASERISDLFGLAESEAATGELALSNRYVSLARRLGTRYNIRLLPEYRELYCRGCSTYWVEGRTVRTRFRSGRRVRTCLVCGRARRVVIRRFLLPRRELEIEPSRLIDQTETALVDDELPRRSFLERAEEEDE
jgi:ribonuclease P protein subunit RPR2